MPVMLPPVPAYIPCIEPGIPAENCVYPAAAAAAAEFMN